MTDLYAWQLAAAILHTVASATAVVVVVGAAIIWKWGRND